MVERYGNHPIIYINIRAYLQHRRAAVAAGQRLDMRLWCNHGHFNAVPGEPLETQHFLGLL